MHWILLPGMDATGDLFAPFLSVIPREITPTVISYPLHEKLSYAELEEIVWRRLPDEPFVLIAESFSGPLALRIAERAPRHLRAVVLCATFVQFPAGIMAKLLATMVGPFMFRLPPPTWLLRSFLWNRESEGVQTLFQQAIAKVSPQVFAHRLQSIVEVDVCRSLATINLPMFVLAGTKDRLVPPQNAEKMKRLNPALIVHYLEAPHLLLQTKPQEALIFIQEFLAQHGA